MVSKPLTNLRLSNLKEFPTYSGKHFWWLFFFPMTWPSGYFMVIPCFIPYAFHPQNHEISPMIYIYMLYDPWKSQWFTLMIYPEKKTDFWWMVKSGQIMSDWWYTYHLPLWKTWLRQLGSSKSPIHGKKHVPNHQPVYIYILWCYYSQYMEDVHEIPRCPRDPTAKMLMAPKRALHAAWQVLNTFLPGVPGHQWVLADFNRFHGIDGGIRISCFYFLAEHETGFTELGISKLNCNTGDRNHQDEQPTFETWHLRTHSTPSLSKHLGTSKHTLVIFTNNNFGYQYIYILTYTIYSHRLTCKTNRPSNS